MFVNNKGHAVQLLNVGLQSNAAAVGDTSAVDKTLSDVVKGVSKLTPDDTTCRTVAGTGGGAASVTVTAVGTAPVSHLPPQDTSTPVVAPVANR